MSHFTDQSRGNYRHYYAKRRKHNTHLPPDRDERLERLVTRSANGLAVPCLFENKVILDVGCNSGAVTTEIGQFFRVCCCKSDMLLIHHINVNPLWQLSATVLVELLAWISISTWSINAVRRSPRHTLYKNPRQSMRVPNLCSSIISPPVSHKCMVLSLFRNSKGHHIDRLRWASRTFRFLAISSFTLLIGSIRVSKRMRRVTMSF